MSHASKLLIASSVCAALLSACSSVSLAPVDEKSSTSSTPPARTAPVPAAPAAPAEPVAQAVPLGGSPAAAPVRPAAKPATGTYVVQRGDTLYRIAKNHGVSVHALMSENGITDPTKLETGRTLKIPGGASAVHSAAAPGAAAAAPAPKAAQSAPAASAEAQTAVKTVPGTGEALQWPVKGEVTKGFSAATRGIDIKAARGTPVKAAANGEVLLISNAFKGYGTIVILRHGDGNFVTTYGQLQSVAVKKGERVKAGQKIATVGGLNASSPVLHFEVRIAGKPVDPREYLR
ncbi:LysM peptidoglycan-binding domain-containing M23 family metallopeptidase [Mesosutterella sp. OilRF-GAM-744-9]|uniref:LysM peptidoglycan-binding domain-containing M23 family metallopeptidase n=1 Tax=Mesosutterella porci TaxID=2915351 RepID=A0ABS9MT67_9BURK|nr:M23 family metallopeptidase [Mesosutterella sp. oilRF-744-WT-GAM-9]MCG5031812.1 LysM peptidoglycan-binding domain-containing M23 family metallopeptidase [Mesosutterella sp. oilRF-744-WT-GAM-9]